MQRETLGNFNFVASPLASGETPKFLFTENETNEILLFKTENRSPYVKDAFNEYIIHGNEAAVNPEMVGTKAAAYYQMEVPAGESVTVRLRLFADSEASVQPFDEFEQILTSRIRESEEFYAQHINKNLSENEKRVVRQAYAGLLWNKQFYNYGVKDWLEGDLKGTALQRNGNTANSDWTHLYNRDVISMPDKWEYPWYATWDLAFHLVAFADIDADFAKKQCILFLREWYMHPNGAIPAYEYGFSDTNPPVLPWACWRIYKITGKKGERDRVFLARVFQILRAFYCYLRRDE